MSLQSAARAFPPPATLWYPSSWRDLHRRANVDYSCIIEIQNDGDEPERLLGATIEGAGTGVLYKLTENNGHFTSRPFEEGLVIKPHGSIELPPTAYQFKFGKITKAIVADTMVNGTLVFEKLHSVPIEFMVEEDDTAPKEDPTLAEDGKH
jgi:periplasmic copper chaperone A